MKYGFTDFQGNKWADCHIDTYNRLTRNIDSKPHNEALLNGRNNFFKAVVYALSDWKNKHFMPEWTADQRIRYRAVEKMIVNCQIQRGKRYSRAKWENCRVRLYARFNGDCPNVRKFYMLKADMGMSKPLKVTYKEIPMGSFNGYELDRVVKKYDGFDDELKINGVRLSEVVAGVSNES